MSEQTTLDNDVHEPWRAESLRLTCFPAPSAEINGADWWRDLVGEEPENRLVRHKEGFRQDTGNIGKAQLVLGIQPTRIDWLLSPVGEDQEDRSLGSFQDSLTLFSNLMIRWLASAPTTNRLALGSILAIPVNDRVQGYEQIAQFLPNIKIDPVGSSDFLYQINRPRTSQTGIKNLIINRLSKWSVGRSGVLQVLISLNRQQQDKFISTPESFGCRLELDINTYQDFGHQLPYEQLETIFKELITLSQEISTKGDIP